MSAKEAKATIGLPSPSPRPVDIFITPRVLDQAAFDTLAKTLRELIAGAEEAGSGLDCRLAGAHETAAKTDACAIQLQERLVLSAKMLKAFGAQIDRVQSAIHGNEAARREAQDAQRLLNERLERFDASVNEILNRAQQRLDETLTRAIEQLCSDVDARFQVLARLEKSIADGASNAQSLVSLVERAEQNIAVRAHKAAQAAEKGETIAGDMQFLITRASETRAQLSHSLQAAADQIDLIAQRSEALEMAAKQRLAECDAIEQNLAARTVRMTETAADAATMFQQSDAVRSRMSGELRGLSDVLQESASRMESLMSIGQNAADRQTHAGTRDAEEEPAAPPTPLITARRVDPLKFRSQASGS